MIVKFSFDETVELDGCGSMSQEIDVKGFQYIKLKEKEIKRLKEKKLKYSVGCDMEETIFVDVKMEVIEKIDREDIYISLSTHDIFSDLKSLIEPTFKIVLVGEKGCGKTSLMSYIKNQKIPEKYIASSKMEFHKVFVETDKGKVTLSIYEFPGDESKQGLFDGYCIGIDYAIIMYSTDPNSALLYERRISHIYDKTKYVFIKNEEKPIKKLLKRKTISIDMKYLESHEISRIFKEVIGKSMDNENVKILKWSS